MDSRFYALNIRRYQQRAQIETPDTIYWERLEKPEFLKECNTIDYLDFSPSDPDNFVVTCSVRVQIYNLVTKLVVKNLSRFQKTAYGATFRQDGRLLAAGDEEGHVKLFDTTSRNILRIFKGHKAPVHRTFFTNDKLQLTSFCDDKSVRLWDVSNEKVVNTYNDAHTDYIRAGAMHPLAGNMFVSGGYDGKINLYDTRAENAIQRTLDHGSPVESLLFMPNGSIFISAGGNQVRVWDLISGCRLLTMMSQHHKTVTCLRLGTDGRRLFSAGLDRHVKIYDTTTYKTVHTLTYPNAVVSLGVASGDQAVVAGMVDGLISIKRMIVENKPSHLNKIRVSHAVKEKRKLVKKLMRPDTSQAVDHTIKNRFKSTKLQTYDVHLRKFNFKKALDEVLLPLQVEKHPENTVAVITELLQRRGPGQGPHRTTRRSSHPSISIFSAHTWAKSVLCDRIMNAANTVLDIFEVSSVSYSLKVMEALQRLSTAIQAEIAVTVEMLQLKGAMDTIIGVSLNDNYRPKTRTSTPKEVRMQPSARAEKYVIYVD
ncbi:GL13335 [Drosophila persimilis]|uniref:U3 small nucleolar RNA-associated protein 15 homolog n=1 Tax=Drosophila persimilis TaxID=7234 RepID=B4H357_DROPE|nr:GL13335 [Drosophila persimilis]